MLPGPPYTTNQLLQLVEALKRQAGQFLKDSQDTCSG